MKAFSRIVAAGCLMLAIVAAVAPWRLPDAAVSEALAFQTRHGPEVSAAISGPVTFKLLPRPRIQAANLSIADHGGVVAIDAPALRADVDITSLLRGRWRLDTATLIEPTITIDLDRLRVGHDAAAVAADRDVWPTRFSIRSGLLRTHSSAAFTDIIATGLDATASWPGGGDGLVVSGSSTWRGTSVVFTGSLDRPDQVFSTDGSTGAIQVDSPIFSLAANGRLSGDGQARFAGHVAASTSSPLRLMRALDGFALGITAKRIQISGDLVARPHDISLSDAQLKLDRAKFEGTLAMRRESGRDLVEGTLATDLLDVDALLGDAGNRGAVDALFDRPVNARDFSTDVDLRVSASTTRIGRLNLVDTAFGALLRGGRLELTLDEAAAYGGLIKARAIANLGQDGVDTHVELASTGVDLDRLSDALSGQDRFGGLLTAQAVLDGHGTNLRDVVAKLDGKGQITIDNGRLAGLSVGQMLKRLGRRLPIEGAPKAQPTTFDKASWGFSIDRGTLKIPEGRLTAPGLQMSFGAQTALSNGRTDIHALATQTDAGGLPVAGAQRMPFDMRGTWDGPFVLVGQTGGIALPPLSIPLLDYAPRAR